ncbi:uncharacterized protein [Channa argus]|uniref:uncharacterized protein isoform X2 n=1 Tax=Channa argus TaxID=215402 RepID=UPI003522A3B2
MSFMAALTSVSFVAFFTYLWIFAEASEETQEVEAKPGDDVSLECRGSRDAALRLWIRLDLISHVYVFFHRDGRSFEDYQHPSFHGRVELKDPQMKDGDFSLILKNVTINDTGRYECRVGKKHTGRRRRDNLQLISTVKLKVTVSGDTARIPEDGEHKGEGNKHKHVGLSVVGFLVLLLLLGLAIFWKTFHRPQQPPADESVENQQL